MQTELIVPWKTVDIGIFHSAKGARDAILDAGMVIDPDADDLLGKIQFLRSRVRTELVVLSPSELGFREGGSHDQICLVAQTFGFGLCPAEVGVALRLEYLEQPDQDWVFLGMETAYNKDKNPITLSIGRSGPVFRLGVGRAGMFHRDRSQKLVFLRSPL